MALPKRPPNYMENKETIVTNLALTTAIGLKMFLHHRLPKWIKNRNRIKILIICGAHGGPKGNIIAEAESNSLQCLKVSLQMFR